VTDSSKGTIRRGTQKKGYPKATQKLFEGQRREKNAEKPDRGGKLRKKAHPGLETM